jgi:pimeloyl-ACP methyl ester carboxylesterase
MDAGPAHRMGKKISLAATKLPATGVRQGSLLFISGGPGFPGINPFVADGALTQTLKAHYDIIGYDARGVGQSYLK